MPRKPKSADQPNDLEAEVVDTDVLDVDPDSDLAAEVDATDDDVETVVLDTVEVIDELEPFDALVSSHGRLIETPVDPGPPPLYGFEQEPPKDSSILLDEPDPEPAPEEPVSGVGAFVGFGVEQVSRADGEWLVDPETGCITKPV